MPFKKINENNKLHINLSYDAMMIIRNDMDCFQVKHRSTFINQIIANYRQEAEASISLSVEAYQAKLEDKLAKSGMGNLENKKEFVDAMVGEHTRFIKKKSEDYGKGKGFKIRLNEDNIRYLCGENSDCRENIYYDACGAYVKAILEEYCQKDFVEREMIYAKELFDQIGEAVDMKRWVEVTFVSGKKVKIKPYAITTDLLSMYHYVIGYENVMGADGEWEKRSFSCRIANLKRAKRMKKQAFISEKDKKQLDLGIRSKGAQFMCEDIIRCTVHFTDEGIQLYRRMLHLRPVAVGISEDGHTYTFECSQKQIEFYIFKFGADAEVLSPESLRDKFREKYQAAVEVYNS